MSRRISNLRVVQVGPSPEDVLPNPDGSLFTRACSDGRILHVIAADGSATQIADTGGRPLGLDWLPDGRLVVCDTRLGLLTVNPEGDDPDSGDIEALVLTRNGVAPHMQQSGCCRLTAASSLVIQAKGI